MDPEYNYNLAGVGAVVGIITETPGVAAFGNGDSGGPGIVPANDVAGNLVLLAASIISAIPQGSTDACQGEPATPGPTGRKCSKIGITTKVTNILQLTGTSLILS